MARVLVHLHLFYENQLDYFLEKLSNLNGCRWDLFVTFCRLSDLSIKKLRCFKSDVHLLQTENVGYDVWPFISVLKTVDLDSYDYLIKLHTKNLSGCTRINGCHISSLLWRNIMVDTLLCSPDLFLSHLDRFEKDPSLGMLCNRVLYKNISKGSPEDLQKLEDELECLGIRSSDRHFCAGTMFMARISPFKVLLSEKVTADRFGAGVSHSFGSLSHVYERVFGCLVTGSGLKIGTKTTRPILSLKAIVHDAVGPALSWLFSVHRMGEDRDKFVTILGHDVKLNQKRHFWVNLKIVMLGHIFVAPWRSRQQRRHIRGTVTQKVVCSYLNQYLPFIISLSPSLDRQVCTERKIFSIWLQGEDNSPKVVKSCLGSVRANCPEEFILLDENNLFDYITLPDYIMDKWRSGRIRPAHFADICRVELLCRYGGLWLDATDFVNSEFPQWLWETPFFVYMAGDRQRGHYSFIQNCFIRADKSSFLIQAWRDLIFEYWRQENGAVDYFVHQLLFRMLVSYNGPAHEEFLKMPSLSQDPTHVLWFENAEVPFDSLRFQRICGGALFQKTEYKSRTAKCPPQGSMAQALENMYVYS